MVTAVSPWLVSLARHRLVYFAVLGSALFAIAPPSRSAKKVSIGADYLASLQGAEAAKLGVIELPVQARHDVERRAIEDEVLYREALRLGLDRDDAVIRQHLIQKVLVLAEDLAGASREPSEDEIRAYFQQHLDSFRHAQEEHLIFVFATRREVLIGLADAVDAAEAERPGVAPPLGDAFPMTRDVRASRRDLESTYGESFARAAFEMPVHVWSEPTLSRFGWHLVKVLDRTEGRPETFEEARGRARLELAVERRHEAIARFVERALARYDVDVAGTKVTDHTAMRRLAMRGSPSGED